MSHEADCFKLGEDLDSVQEKVQLYIELLGGGISRDDDAMGEVVAFLEACKERLAEVIEAGTKGELTEEIFG